ncbi:hypothetical protein BOX15_Mlig033047g1 [Macrostomum lignano]|uniref:Amiloride sensitive cation channel n=2 Tax=Macrostomum lignano TaxID=282301 RepID=A0A1I8J2R4_9PLAT|nr:hypothetical protein BOX15_Mlig033047g1 [Macrostomum lignano]
MSDSIIQQLNDSLTEISAAIERSVRNSLKNTPGSSEADIAQQVEKLKLTASYVYPLSIPYTLLVSALAHRAEQAVLLSSALKANKNGFAEEFPVPFTQFYHQTQLRCFRWSADNNSELQSIQSRNSLEIAMFLDNLDETSAPNLTGKSVESPVYAEYRKRNTGTPVYIRMPVTDWPLALRDSLRPDRRSGVRLFLMPPGEYPSNFGTSILLEPGKYYQIELSMRQEERNADQFDCVSTNDLIQFLNPYDFEPYSHSYSYSYCYFDKFNENSLAIYNFTTPGIPTTWRLRHSQTTLNMSGPSNILDHLPAEVSKIESTPKNFDEATASACKSRAPCSSLIYDAQISSASWPTSTSLRAFIGTTVADARDTAVLKGISVPGLEFLVNASSESSSMSPAAIAFANANLLKLEIRPQRMDCDKLKFSIDYGFENFVADIGGIMGIYLGMSLLTICELLDLIAELAYTRHRSASVEEPSAVEGEPKPSCLTTQM